MAPLGTVRDRAAFRRGAESEEDRVARKLPSEVPQESGRRFALRALAFWPMLTDNHAPIIPNRPGTKNP